MHTDTNIYTHIYTYINGEKPALKLQGSFLKCKIPWTVLLRGGAVVKAALNNY